MRILITIITLLISFSISASQYNVPDNMNSAAQWDSFEQTLLQDKDDTIILFWSGYGGYISVLDKFIKTLDQLHARHKEVVFILFRGSFSAQAVAVCYGDTIIWEHKAFLMFHKPMTTDLTTNKDLPYEPISEEAHNSWAKGQLQCLAKGLLQPGDITILAGKNELYIMKMPDGSYHRLVKFDVRYLEK